MSIMDEKAVRRALPKFSCFEPDCLEHQAVPR